MHRSPTEQSSSAWFSSAAAAAAKLLQSCPTLRLHRWQPTRLPCPWDSPGKNTGVGCHFLLQCMKVKSEREVTQSCPTRATPWTAAYQAPPSMGFSSAGQYNLSFPPLHSVWMFPDMLICKTQDRGKKVAMALQGHTQALFFFVCH